MSLHVLGINHQTAPVALREKVAFAPDALAAALASLRALPQVHEAVLLSTCNRTELYAHTDDDGRALADWLAIHPDTGHDLHAYLYRHRDGDAVRHLFRVATGLSRRSWARSSRRGRPRAMPAPLAASSTACSSRPSPPPSARAPTPASAPTRCRWRPLRCAWRRNRSPASAIPACC